MKLTKLVTACMIVPFLLALCVVTASAAGAGGTLVATDALEIKAEKRPIYSSFSMVRMSLQCVV